jgi:hypothetical protein
MRHTALLAVLRWTLLVVFIGGLALGWMLGAPPGRQQIFVLTVAVYAAVGWLVTRQRPENPLGWLFLLVATMTGLGAIADGLTQRALDLGDPGLWFGRWGAWLAAWFWFPLFASATLFTLLLFPDGLASRRWRPVLWVSVAASALLTLGVSMQTLVAVGHTQSPSAGGSCPSGQTLEYGSCGRWVDNPLGAPSSIGNSSWGTVIGTVLLITLSVCFLIAVVGVIRRYRASHGETRLQMRWFSFGAIILLGWLVFATLFVKGEDQIWSEIAFTLATAGIPASCGIAITRYRLYDIDRVISRTASYGIVTAAVLLTYAVVVTTVTTLVPASNTLAVAGATLAAAALARPLLHRVQDVVDRRFNRTRYDAAHTVDAFADTIRHTVDRADVTASLDAVVHASLQPSEYRLWVRP